MAPMHDGHEYYKRMLELQEKLRKSEEERIRLEERFNLLVQESRNRHDACVNRLRLRYIEFLEEQRARDERNRKLLGTLDRVDSSLTLMSAKTERLNFLRKQYEAYLLRVCGNRRAPGSITGDSGIASQNEERHPKSNAHPNHVSPEIKIVSTSEMSQADRLSYSVPKYEAAQCNVLVNPEGRVVTQPNVSAGVNYRQTSFQEQFPTIHDNSVLRLDKSQMNTYEMPHQMLHPQLPRVSGYNTSSVPESYRSGSILQHKQMHGYPDQTPISYSQHQSQPQFRSRGESPILAPGSRNPSEALGTLLNHYPTVPSNHLKSESEMPAHSLTSSDVENMIRRNEHIFKKYFKNKSLYEPSTSHERNSYADEQERTTGILENELHRYIERIKTLHRKFDTRSPEDIDHEQNTSGDLLNVTLSEEVQDLPAEKTKEDRVAEGIEKVLALADDLVSRTLNLSESKHEEKPKTPGEMFIESENRNLGITALPRRDVPVSGKTCTPKEHEVQTTNEISDNIAPHQLQLEHADQNTEMLTKQDRNSMRPDISEAPHNQSIVVSEVDKHQNILEDTKSKETADASRDAQKQVNLGHETNMNGDSFNVTEELKPWNLENLEKRVKEINLHESLEKEPIDDVVNSSNDNVEIVEVLQESTSDVKNIDAKESLNTEDVSTEELNIDDMLLSNKEDNANKLNENIEDNTSISASISEHNRYKHEAQDEPLENVNETDQLDNSDKKQKETLKDEQIPPEEKYTDESNEQGYVENINQEFIDPNQQYNYDQNVYDPNTNQGNEGYANQEYAQGADQQYTEYAGDQYEQYDGDPNNAYVHDPNQQYEQDPTQYPYNYDQQYDPNQTYETDPNAQAYGYENYNPNQTYDNTQNQECPQEETSKPEEQIADDNRETAEETAKETESPEMNQSETRENVSPEVATQPKKKKDVIKSLLDSDTDSTIERNVSNTESDFDFN